MVLFAHLGCLIGLRRAPHFIEPLTENNVAYQTVYNNLAFVNHIDPRRLCTPKTISNHHR